MTDKTKEGYYERADARLNKAIVQVERAISWIEDIPEVIAQGNVDELERLIGLIDEARVKIKFRDCLKEQANDCNR